MMVFSHGSLGIAFNAVPGAVPYGTRKQPGSIFTRHACGVAVGLALAWAGTQAGAQTALQAGLPPVLLAALPQSDAQEQRRAQDREHAVRQQQESGSDVSLPTPATPSLNPSLTLSLFPSLSPSLSAPAEAALTRLVEGESPCFPVNELLLQVMQGDKAAASDFDWALAAAAGPDGANGLISALGAGSRFRAENTSSSATKRHERS